MTKKMLIKVTVDEALFPELYQRLDEYENPRLRAAVLRSLASDTVRLLTTGAPRAPATGLVSTPPPTDRHRATRATGSTPPALSRPLVATDEKRPVAAAEPDAMSELSDRFNVDEIADQFAGF
ncbi:hypothetical protein AWB80_04144 [Caballeronia pedi]|uniref:Uncharacterized protein n=1 Tax=Caballeronia pedi TaxID=1777141 RepID=A0A158BUB4_9BURK|nr:hypothetical protein [Caballeronia pedi]SAK73675.1 hypothetical protein AWB80_04144 [Caballeronia pedi]